MNEAIIGTPTPRRRQPIKNAEASASIPVGTPVSLNISGTRDGIDVVLPSSSAAKATAFHYGVAASTLTAGQSGEAVVGGLVDAIILQKTRAASTDDWSASTISSGVLLQVNTVHNAYATSGGTLAASAYIPWGVLAESTVMASSASATSDTRTAITGRLKVYLRVF